MAALVCDLCGGKLIMGESGIATCDSCGMEHSIERMREKVQEVKGVVQTDNSHLIGNYLDMANSAIDAGNNAEAETYCNRIIEVDPTNYKAWILKGDAAAWQSSLSNIRLTEGINAFAKGIMYAPEEAKSSLTEYVVLEIKRLCAAITQLQTERFMKWPDDDETDRLVSLVDIFVDAIDCFAQQSEISISAKEIIGPVIEPVAILIDKAVAQAYRKVIYPNYRSDKNPYPDQEDFSKYIAGIERCIKLLTKTANLRVGNDEDNISRYEELISYDKRAIDARGYYSQYQNYLKYHGHRAVKQMEDVVRSKGFIPDSEHNRVYAEAYKLSDESKNTRIRRISIYKEMINLIKKEQARREAAEKAEKERIAKEEAQRRYDEYWAEHTEEKISLEKEQEELKEQVDAIFASLNEQVAAYKKELAAVPGATEISDIERKIREMIVDKERLGIFKGKEKKALQIQIEQAEANKKNIKDRMDAVKDEIESKIAAAKAEAQKRANPLQSRLNAISTELTKER